jgi:hypothetical protein
MADDQVEDRVSQELEPLVVLWARVTLLVAPRRVTEGLFEERPLLERIAENGF